MHPGTVRAEALALIAQGVNDCEVARRLGIPRGTVRDWRRPRYVSRNGPATTCPRCWRSARPVAFTPADYTELLGLYLGDGHITAMARTERLRLSLDSRYPKIVEESDALLRRCFPSNRVGRVTADDGATTVLMVYNGHLSCLFPQHGPGKKHERRLALEPWQAELVAAAPWPFLRGCIRSDGCAYINRTGRYSYLSYCFDNLSEDIRMMFVEACGHAGVDCRHSGKTVRIYRRASVALFEQHVGLKS